MAPSIGLNLRVTGYKHQGGRKYMEDEFGVAYQQTADEKDLEYAFFGIFDGHGGREAALFAKEHLMDFIVRQKGFWLEDDESVLKAIHEGFIQTHYAMWKELEKWPKTASGLPSTAGTTASIAFIRRGKIYIGHVGDSAIVLGVQDPDNPDIWRAEPLTRDHKPESLEESERIQQCGGKVICKSGVPRVVWNRPRMGHKGPVRRSTHIDEIPFLAVARSLGDLWSYNSEENVFVVSPEPDIRVYPVDISKHRCLILGTDGAWNMLTPQNAISTVCQAEKANEAHMLGGHVEGKSTAWINPSKQLVDTAIERWNASKLRADNTSVVTVMLDPPGPPRAQVLKNRKRELAALNAGRDLPNPNQPPSDRGSMALVTNTTPEEDPLSSSSAAQERNAAAAVEGDSGALSARPEPPVVCGPTASKTGCSIISRFPNSPHPVQSSGFNLVKHKQRAAAAALGKAVSPPGSLAAAAVNYRYTRPSSASSAPLSQQAGSSSFNGSTGRLSESTLVNRGGPAPSSPARQVESSSASSSSSSFVDSDSTVQCNEISSSSERDTSLPRPASPSIASAAATLSELVASSSSSSSQLSDKAATGNNVATPRGRGQKSLSRELSGLRLTDTTPAAVRTRLGTSRSSSSAGPGGRKTRANELSAISSDTENLPSGSSSNNRRSRTAARVGADKQPPAGKAGHVDERRKLNNKLDSIERKLMSGTAAVAESKQGRPTPSRRQQQQEQQPHLLTRSASKVSIRRSATAAIPSNSSSQLSASGRGLRSADTPQRSLRSRPEISDTTTPLSAKAGGIKRRRPLSSEGSAAAAAKSPRTAVVVVKPATVNRSRQAKVLRLKNK